MKLVEYKEEYGEIKFPDGFEEKLLGKSIEEQAALYRINENVTISSYSYGELDGSNSVDCCFRPDEYQGCKALVVKDGTVVGVMLRSYNGSEVCCLPYQERVCTASLSEDDGTGSWEREDYAWLTCL